MLDNAGNNGDCGFRALAQQLTGNEDDYGNIKSAMLNHYLKWKEDYITAYPTMMNHDDLLHILTTDHAWFSTPECSQVAANTFGRPIAVYPSRAMQGLDEMFFPMIHFDYPKNIPLPLVLQNHCNSHSVTVQLKRSKTPHWPIPSTWHTHAVLNLLGHADDKVKTYWKRVLHFNRSVHFPLIIGYSKTE